jgi:hypothetical protein
MITRTQIRETAAALLELEQLELAIKEAVRLGYAPGTLDRFTIAQLLSYIEFLAEHLSDANQEKMALYIAKIVQADMASQVKHLIGVMQIDDGDPFAHMKEQSGVVVDKEAS